jgi:hypothetical protein
MGPSLLPRCVPRALTSVRLDSASFARATAGLAAALLSVGALIACAVNVFADGSQSLYPSGAPGFRANTEWRTGSYGAGAVTRRTLLHAYATTGESLLVGSTAIGKGVADILIWNPGLVTGTPGNEDPRNAVVLVRCATRHIAHTRAG